MTRNQRHLYKRILKMLLTNNAIFLTLSFNDEILNKTNAETRKRYIKQFLNEETSEYILNIDYGKTNNREHYHAIAIANDDLTHKLVLSKYKYGQIDAKFINASWKRKKGVNRYEETAFYLMRHATKDTTRNNKIISSRCKRKP